MSSLHGFSACGYGFVPGELKSVTTNRNNLPAVVLERKVGILTSAFANEAFWDKINDGDCAGMRESLETLAADNGNEAVQSLAANALRTYAARLAR